MGSSSRGRTLTVGILGRIVNAFVFVAIEHDSRRVHLLGITRHPTDDWVANRLRAATMDGEPLAGRKHWIHDNDSKYGRRFRAVLGSKRVRTSIRAPDMNAMIERWIKSAKEECLNHVVFLNEAMLAHYAASYIQHYNEERPHQGIGNRPVGPWESSECGAVVCDQRLGGLLTSFRRAA